MPRRESRYAIRPPSGDHVGSNSDPGRVVSRLTCEPSARITKMSSSMEKVTRPDREAMEMGGPEGEGVAAVAGVAGRLDTGPRMAAWLQPAPRIATAKQMSPSPRPFMLPQLQAERGSGSRGPGRGLPDPGARDTLWP